MVGCWESPAETPDFCSHQTGLPWQDMAVYGVPHRTQVQLRPLPSTLLQHRLLPRHSSCGYAVWSLFQPVCLRGEKTREAVDFLTWLLLACYLCSPQFIYFFPPRSLADLLCPLLKPPL